MIDFKAEAAALRMPPGLEDLHLWEMEKRSAPKRHQYLRLPDGLPLVVPLVSFL